MEVLEDVFEAPVLFCRAIVCSLFVNFIPPGAQYLLTLWVRQRGIKESAKVKLIPDRNNHRKVNIMSWEPLGDSTNK